jgi:hypothetical protein
MKKQSLRIFVLLLGLIFLFSLTSFAAPRYSVSSKIGGTQYGATQEIGHFRVGPNGSASAFQGGAYVISAAENRAIGYGFHIEKIGSGNQKTVVVFERSWNGKVDSPVSLGNLVLGPGYYALVVGGRPGSSVEISFTGSNVTIE